MRFAALALSDCHLMRLGNESKAKRDLEYMTQTLSIKCQIMNRLKMLLITNLFGVAYDFSYNIFDKHSFVHQITNVP